MRRNNGNTANSSDCLPVQRRRRRHSRTTSDADEYEPSVAEDDIESPQLPPPPLPPLSSSKARACKRTRFGATLNERSSSSSSSSSSSVYSLRRDTIVSETPRFSGMPASSNITSVVTEESSLSDGSVQHQYGTSKKRYIGKPVAYKRRTGGVKHRRTPKRTVGFRLDQEIHEPLVVDQSTLENTHIRHGTAGKRKRVATNFYKPCVPPEQQPTTKTAATTTFPLRPKRERVAPSFFCPTGEDALVKKELEFFCDPGTSVNELGLDKSSVFSRTRQATTGSKRLLGAFPIEEKAYAANSPLRPRPKRKCFVATCIRPVRKVTRSTGEVVCTDDTGKSNRTVSSTVSNRRTRQSRIDTALDTARLETVESCDSYAEPGGTILLEYPSNVPVCYFTGTTPLSHSILAQQYNELVKQGHCDSVSFGHTLDSARIAIERKIMILSEKCPDEIEDAEITADHREFKRSLRTFVAFEAQEKLALVHEQQDYEEGIQLRRFEAAKSSTLDKMELSKLVDLPIIRSKTSRMSPRYNTCSEGPNCFLCGENTRRTEPNLLHHHTLTPFMRSFDINAVEEEGQAQVESRSRRSIVTRHGKQQDTARATLMALIEMKHSIDFVVEYNSAASTAGTV